MLPELRPGLVRRAADENVGVVCTLFVLDAIGITIVAGKAAGLKHFIRAGARQAENDQCLRRRVAVAAIPSRVVPLMA